MVEILKLILELLKYLICDYDILDIKKQREKEKNVRDCAKAILNNNSAVLSDLLSKLRNS